jgi:phosphoglucomutase/phosphomannomutase
VQDDAWKGLLSTAEAAAQQGSLAQSSWESLHQWLTGEAYCWSHEELRELIQAGKWSDLNDRFYQAIPFGTGGRRGTVGVGTNRINRRTIGESAQGVANYVKGLAKGPSHPTVAIAYDTRHYSVEFSQAAACIFAANGLKVHLFADARPTPELSFAVRELGATVGVVISASHNPPPDNGFKVYWTDGGQLVPPHDSLIMEEVSKVQEVREDDFDEALGDGRIVMVGSEMDELYVSAVHRESLLTQGGAALPAQPKTLYTPLHGTGLYSVPPVLERLGLTRGTDLFLLEEQATPDGDFPNVEHHVANPEEKAVMQKGMERARELGADLLMATDPDADRLGAAVPVSPGSTDWRAFSGNQICSLLTDFVLQQLSKRKALPEGGLVVKTLVTSEMVSSICASHGVAIRDNLLVGFKYIAEVIDHLDRKKRFIFGAEESHGYLKGTYTRDKDAAVSAMVMAELCAWAKSQGRTPFQVLQDLYRQHGYFHESVHSLTLKGMKGQEQIAELMRGLRESPPSAVADLPVTEVRDCLSKTVYDPKTHERRPWDVPEGDLLFFYLGNDGYTRFAARPSGTEPKIKYYITAYADVPLAATNAELRAVASRADAVGQRIAQALIEQARAIEARR